ncbi:MAG: Slp family lipoprotein [Proteobacteria bacterium]|nr:Slp family lipoprotein [Pseudomonadota bacterium]
MRQTLLATTAIAALALAGCASVPAQLAGQNFSTLTPQLAAQQDAHGERVRWGGSIVKVEPKVDTTCFEVLSRELYADARPRPRSQSSGRFIACGKGFYDPELYRKNREITVTGALAGSERHKVGDYDYTYARVDADNIYLWPLRERRDNYSAWPYYYDPFWGPWGPYWGGWWTPPVVIVRPAPPPKP